MIEPLDFSELGTNATIAASEPAAAELLADVLDGLAAELDDELLLLLPHPTIATALTSETARESHLLVRIAPLSSIRARKSLPRIFNLGASSVDL